MTLRSRLEKVEQAASGAHGRLRCATCADWPAVRVQLGDTRCTTPEQCPSCGWAPDTTVFLNIPEPERPVSLGQG